MKKSISLLILIIFLIIPLQAKDSNQQAAFIEDIIGARAWGLGGAYRTLVDDASASIWNPAGLADLKKGNSLSLEHLQLMDFFSYSYVGYAHRLNKRLVLGSGLYYSGDDVMSEFVGYASVAMDGAVIGNLIFSDSIPEELVSIGLSSKIFYSSFGNNDLTSLPDYLIGHQVTGSALGYGLDLGFKVRPTKRDHFSLTFKNLLNNIKWDSKNNAGTALGKYSENLPVTSALGYARHQNNFIIALDIDKGLYYDIEDNLHIGLELPLRRELILRIGYAQELVTADSKRLGLGAGINIDMPSVPHLRVDLSYLMHLEWEGHDSLLFSLTLQ
ncbi:MAG: hypothetical protein K0B81_04965 [Candidatus Cloacimonetes bacterium]|nr:hypothetical protein [Candidatus Cloacimonadota bacterium]